LWWLVLIIPALFLSHGNLVLGTLYYGIIVAVLYVVSLERHSNRRCRWCGGTGRHRGAMFTWGDRLCTKCGGQSRHRRWGVQAFHPGDKAWAERSAAQAKKRRNAPR
jgi:hypothetical protein